MRAERHHLAEPPDDDTGGQPGDAEGRSITVLSFCLGGQDLALDVGVVREILEYRRPVALPQGAGGACGIIDLRGTTVPVIDLAERLGFHGRAEGAGHRSPVGAAPDRQDRSDGDEGTHAREPSAARRDRGEAAGDRRIIVIDPGTATTGDAVTVGVPCDRVNGVLSLPRAALETLPRLPVGSSAVVAIAQAPGKDVGEQPERQGDDGAPAAGTASPVTPAPPPASRAAQPAGSNVLRGVLRIDDGMALLIDHRAVFGLGDPDGHD